MNNKIKATVNAFRPLVMQYKAFLVPVVIIIICSALLVKVIYPQFQSIFVLHQEATKAKEKLSVLKNNFSLLSELSDSTLDSQLKIVNAALPTNKDFIGIINAISYASSINGVSVGDFTLQIGDLSQQPTDTTKFSSISLNLSVNGNIDDINNFLSALSATLPLSEVTSINLGTFVSSVTVNFLYKPLPPVNYSDSTPIKPIKSASLKLINELSTFNYNFSESIEFIGDSFGQQTVNPL